MRIKKKYKDGKKVKGLKGNSKTRFGRIYQFLFAKTPKKKKEPSWTPWWFYCLPSEKTKQGARVESNPLKHGGRWISWNEHLASRKTKTSVMKTL